jgi:hypothetical protein
MTETEELQSVLAKEAQTRLALQVAKAKAYLRHTDGVLRVTEINHLVALDTQVQQAEWEWESARIEVEAMWMRLGVLPPGWTNRTPFVRDLV